MEKIYDRMKLGISYPAFEGIELLPYTLKTVRNHAYFVSVFYQAVSYHGHHIKPESEDLLHDLVAQGLIDKLYQYENRPIHPRQNEVRIRNLGVDASQMAGCTHHISADVDEFYVPTQLEHAMASMEDYDCSVSSYINYYKRPTWRITPRQTRQATSLIQKIGIKYDLEQKFPILMDRTRQPTGVKIKVFEPEEFIIHHMSYVRQDIRWKFINNQNWTKFKIDKFVSQFDKYCLGDRLAVAPDFRNRRTELVDNLFGIGDLWEHPQ